VIEAISGEMLCPNCGNTGLSGRFTVTAPAMFIKIDGHCNLKEVHTDGEVMMECGRCKHQGKISEFMRIY
jgi:hypothetical protein